MKIRSAGDDGHDDLKKNSLAAIATGIVLATSAFPEHKRKSGRFTYVAIESEPAPKLIVDPDNVLEVRAEQTVHRHVTRVLTPIGGETTPPLRKFSNDCKQTPGCRRPPVDRQLKAAPARALHARRTSETARPTGDGDADRGRT